MGERAVGEVVFRGWRWVLSVSHQSFTTTVSVISRVVLLAPQLVVPELQRTQRQQQSVRVHLQQESCMFNANHHNQTNNESMERVKDATTDPLLPALVEGLGLVHAVPVAAEVAAVPIVAKVAVLVAKVTAVATSLVELMKPKYKQKGQDQCVFQLL